MKTFKDILVNVACLLALLVIFVVYYGSRHSFSGVSDILSWTEIAVIAGGCLLISVIVGIVKRKRNKEEE
jgi:uncharacterized membrane protein YhdT